MLGQLSATNRFKQDELNAIDALLKVEEELAQKLLDDLMNKQQEMEILKEKADDADKLRKTHREELVKKHTEYSCLVSKNKKQKEELDVVTAKNKELEAKNIEQEKKNKEMQQDIFVMIQRIELNSLLKEVDIEDLKTQAKQNMQMNKAFDTMVARWNMIFSAKPDDNNKAI